MDETETNKLLTKEVFDECWHEWEWFKHHKHKCIKCKKDAEYIDYSKLLIVPQPDFFSLEGCMKLFLKIQEMEWFDEFTKEYGDYECGLPFTDSPIFWFKASLIHPDSLAPAVAEFLKGRK